MLDITGEQFKTVKELDFHVRQSQKTKLAQSAY